MGIIIKNTLSFQKSRAALAQEMVLNFTCTLPAPLNPSISFCVHGLSQGPKSPSCTFLTPVNEDTSVWSPLVFFSPPILGTSAFISVTYRFGTLFHDL